MPITPGVIETVKVRVQTDIVHGLASSFTSDNSADAMDPAFTITLNGPADILDAPDFVAASDTFVAVPWVWACVHTGRFLDVQPTYIRFQLHGTTFVHATAPDPDDWTYYRYIDFLCALYNLGISTSVRPALTADEYLAWDAARPHPLI
jgi:hypothetical protein